MGNVRKLKGADPANLLSLATLRKLVGESFLFFPGRAIQGGTFGGGGGGEFPDHSWACTRRLRDLGTQIRKLEKAVIVQSSLPEGFPGKFRRCCKVPP